MTAALLALALLTPQMLDHDARIPSSQEIEDLCLEVKVDDSEAHRCFDIAADLRHLEFFREAFQLVPDTEAEHVEGGQVAIRYAEWLDKRLGSHRRIAQNFIKMWTAYKVDGDPDVAASLDAWIKIDLEMHRFAVYLHLLRGEGTQ